MHQVGQRRCADGCLPWSMAMLQCGSLACVREVAKILQFRLVEHPLVPRGTFRRFGLRAPIPAENLVSLSVRWGAGAPAKAIRRGGPPLARRTRRPPKHASEPSRAICKTRHEAFAFAYEAGLPACGPAGLSRMRHPSVALRMALFAHMT